VLFSFPYLTVGLTLLALQNKRVRVCLSVCARTMACCGPDKYNPSSVQNNGVVRLNYRDTALPIENGVTLKVISLGSAGIGKSQMLRVLSGQSFDSSNVATIGVDVITIMLDGEESRYKAMIWDTAGQERFSTIVRSYYRDVHVALLCFDLTSEESFERMKKFLLETRAYAPTNAVLLLIGTKLDLVESDPDKRNPVDFTKEIGLAHLPYIELSAKTGQNIKKLKSSLLSIAEQFKVRQENPPNRQVQQVRLLSKPKTKRRASASDIPVEPPPEKH